MAEPTAQEVLMQALINRARLDPAGEAARYGIDLNQGLAAGTITTASKQPLAFNSSLLASADLHSQNMIDRDFFAHNDPLTGTTPQARGNNAGYIGSVGENISWGGSTGTIDATVMIYDQHEGLFRSSGHRSNMLSGGYEEFGVGQVLGVFTSAGVNYNASMVTENFGVSSASDQFLTGVAYHDINADAFYSVGEGRAGLSISTSSGSAVTAAAGAYSRAVAAGAQTITFSDGDLAALVAVTAMITSGKNALINLIGPSTVETSTSLTAGNGVSKIIGLGNFGLSLTGNDAANTIVSAPGNDVLNGAGGFDTAVFSGDRANYTITTNADGSTTVTGLDGTDTLTSIEMFQFADTGVAPDNTPPIATINDQTVSFNKWTQVSNWLSYSDADDNPATHYEFWDSGTGSGSGYFWTSGNSHHDANTSIPVAAADLNDVWLRGGQAAGSETIWVRAFDGTDWSAWDSFTFATVGNTSPVATIDDQSLAANQWSQLTSWISYSDFDGNAATRYQFWDEGTDSNSGYFWTPRNAHHRPDTAIPVSAANLDNVWVRGGQAEGAETMYVRAFDGAQWSAWDSFTLNTIV